MPAIAPLTGHTALTSWQFAPQVSAILAVAAIGYLIGAVRVRRRHPARPWPVLRSASFLAGLATIALATQSSIGVYDDTLFWVHMVQHLLLVMVAPALLVAGRPVILLMHAWGNPVHRWARRAVRSRLVTALTCPPVALVIYTGVIVGTHLTSLMNLTLEHPWAHDGEHLLYLAAGYLFFLPLLGSEPIRWRMSMPGRFLLLAVAMPVDTFVGVVLNQTNHELFPAYARAGRTWGPSLIADLHAGGAVMWVGGDALMLGFILIVFLSFLTDQREGNAGAWLETARRNTLAEHAANAGLARVPAARVARHATVDDDAHLAAYNAYLARLSGRAADDPPGER
ncbi:MAG TPA: cytochrome c oxidase assembly protein [Mycobacteriales bacterium]|nr:cytochrome c oxidase assembly protein [Mycobacteriales bacterium]